MKQQNVTSNYNEHEVLKSISRKKAIDVVYETKTIMFNPNVTNDVGIKTKGKLDFLKKYCGWTMAA